MSKDITDLNFKELSNVIVLQACTDLKSLCTRSHMYQLVDVELNSIINKVLILKEFFYSEYGQSLTRLNLKTLYKRIIHVYGGEKLCVSVI